MTLPLLLQVEIPIAAILLLVLMVAVFMVMRQTITRTGPYGRLIKRYAVTQDPNTIMGERISIPVIRLNKLSYKSFFRFVKSGKGLYMYPVWLVRTKTSNILIPWHDFTTAERFERLWVKMVRLRIGRPEITSMEITKEAFDKFKEKLDIIWIN